MKFSLYAENAYQRKDLVERRQKLPPKPQKITQLREIQRATPPPLAAILRLNQGG